MNKYKTYLIMQLACLVVQIILAFCGLYIESLIFMLAVLLLGILQIIEK